MKPEYFGQYGNILKIVANTKNPYFSENSKVPSFSAYITFSNSFEASICILAVDGTFLEGQLVRASFGTTKYCSSFQKGLDCNNKDCLYLHKFASDDEVINKVRRKVTIFRILIIIKIFFISNTYTLLKYLISIARKQKNS
jgi:CCR4-NOT transcription complex subunit 4